MDSDFDVKHSSPEERNPKRRMKTPFQLEALERVYAEDRYPTEAVRAELSLHLNLSDKQLQMWFCHRRLKDRKGKDGEDFGGPNKHLTELPRGYSAVVPGSDVRFSSKAHVYNDKFGFEEQYRGIGHGPISPCIKTGGLEIDMMPLERNKLAASRDFPARMAAGTVAEAADRYQPGESVYSDGPVLGVEFDPLPPGAFGSMTEHISQQPTTISPQPQQKDGRAVGQEIIQRKGGGVGLPPLSAEGIKQRAVGLSGQQYINVEHFPSAPREFQFLPEQPTAREESNHRQPQLNLDLGPERCYQVHLPSRPNLPSNILLGPEEERCKFQQESADSVAISLFLQGESNGSYMANELVLEEVEQEGLRYSFDIEGQVGTHHSALQPIGTKQPLLYSASLPLFQEHRNTRIEKKRKSEEIKAAKETEARVKRMRRDLEREEIVRRKREDQMRRELERLDREKRKDEDRANKERQREEERLQRDQRRETDRQEKMLLKENKKIEKQQQKEEVRKAKEAARLKAASERAAAKKISKETVDTIEDEQLELLEATTAKGLFLINGFEESDSEPTDASKVQLKKFPPATVRMKEPLSCWPLNILEHAVGHLLMVWRFLTTFADVLGLWCFTLDEFTQALHDFDPRLLSEIHICLIKIILKDIEDAAQAASSGVAGSQNAIILASGGHAQIVDMVHQWGFDIQEWGRQLSPLSWPEILRQFGLAAGYGPKWRKCGMQISQPREDCEAHREEENAVRILRSGAAAASAVAVMQGKGVGLLRRCRNRLTPGTVKYAAFHILSLEGGKGLTILEVAEKIQKSGLRDLTTSKTPEASIAAALSRDTNLFERVAPSTYSVRSAFRKDVEDTDEVLQLARERIGLFQSGFLDVDDAEKETDDAEEVERDGGYDSDGQDVEESDGGHFPLKDSDMKTEKQEESLETAENLRNQDMEIDEGKVGEPWVQGLTEGEYSDLSVEERLMALVALVNVVNEGNSIRQALEARMEAASGMKRQIWAEAQIERRRHKEEHLSKLQLVPLSSKNEGDEVSLAIDVGSNFVFTSTKPNESILRVDNETAVELNLVSNESSNLLQFQCTSEPNLPLQDKSLTMQENCCPVQEGAIPQDVITVQGHVMEKSRPHMKAESGICAEELYVVRSVPVGLDRRRNRYWQFVACSGGQDPSEGRIYFECSSDGHWGVIDNEEVLEPSFLSFLMLQIFRKYLMCFYYASLFLSVLLSALTFGRGWAPVQALDALMMSLDTRGTREAALHAALVRLEFSLRIAMRNAAAPGHNIRSSGFDVRPVSRNIVTDYDNVREGGGSGISNSITQLESPHFSGAGLQESGAAVGDLRLSNDEMQSFYTHVKDFEQWIWSEHSRVLSAWRVNFRRKESDLLASCIKCHDVYWATERHHHSCSSAFAELQMKQDMCSREFEEKRKKSSCRTFCELLTAVPPRIQILKADIVSLEVVVPSEAFEESWDQEHRKAWASCLKTASTAAELLQSITELERGVKLDWLSTLYDTNEALNAGKFGSRKASILDAPWVPCTSAALCLHVMAFDASLACSSSEKQRWELQEDDHSNVVHPSMILSASRTACDLLAADHHANEMENNIPRNVVGSRGRGRHRGGSRSRSGHGSRLNKARLSVKKGAKSKPQARDQDRGTTKTVMILGGKVAARGQGQCRGRARGKGIGRSRGRGSERGSQSQLSVQHLGKLRRQKNLNVPLDPKSKMQNILFEESRGVNKEPEVELASDNDGYIKGEWEDSEEPPEVEGNEENRRDLQQCEEKPKLNEVHIVDPEDDHGLDNAGNDEHDALDRIDESGEEKVGEHYDLEDCESEEGDEDLNKCEESVQHED